MPLPGAEYERELKAILSGDPQAVSQAAKRCGAEGARAIEATLVRPFLVARAAGSLGCDLIAMSGDFSFPIEVKSSIGDTLRFSGSAHLKEQLATLRRECERAGVLPLHAFRRKGLGPKGGDPWRLFTLPGARFTGRMGLVYHRVPKLDTTAKGNLVMRWDDGIPLHRLLAYLDAMRAPMAATPSPPELASPASAVGAPAAR